MLLLTAGLSLAAITISAQTKPSMGSVELTDAAGDVGLIHTIHGSTEKKFPGFDIVKLSIASDGKQITVATTLKSPPAEVAASVVELYFDLDNSKKTGATLLGSDLGGFEWIGELRACVVLSDSRESCAGASATATAKLVRRYATLTLDRFKGASSTDGIAEVVGGFFAPMKAPQAPFEGPVVQATLAYEGLKVASGRTIQIVARESSAGTSPTGERLGFFPEVLLTLK